MADIVLQGELRSETGKGVARRLRREDRIPAVIYGGKSQESQAIAVSGKDLRRAMAEGALGRLVKLDLGQGGSRTALAKDMQVDPVRGDILHVDFHEVALDEAVQVQVPLVLVGEDERENDGGLLTLIVRELKVSCLPTDIPEHLEVSVAGLAIGDTVHVRDLTPPAGVEIVDDPDTVVLTVAAPAVAAGPEEAEGEEGETADDGAAGGEGEG